MTFTSRRLVGNRVMVSGSDVLGTSGQAILDSSQWDEIKADLKFDQATEAFEAAVEEFFKPLTDAADQAQRSVDVPDDPAGYVVLSEGQPGQRAVPRHIVKLNRDSIVLRLIEQGDTSRLVWVNGELEVLERTAQVSDIVLSGTVEIPEGHDQVPAGPLA